MGSLLLTEAQTTVALGWRPGLEAIPAGASPLSATLLELLGSSPGVSADQLIDEAAGAAIPDNRMLAEIEARSLLDRLCSRGMISAQLLDEQGVAATIATPALPDEPTGHAHELELSPDVFLRRSAGDQGGLILESAADPGRSDPIEPRFASALLSDDLPPAWRNVLCHAGILVATDDDAPGPLDPVDRWEFHDRLFHTRSRLWGRSPRPYGATKPLAGKMDALPGEHLPAGATGAPIKLIEPAPDDAAGYAEVAERRRSRRRAAGSLTIDQLAELLHRTVRVRAMGPAPAGDEVSRPVPSAGSLAAVGVYPLVVDCEGIDPGLYHYSGEEHVLRRIETATDADLAPLVGGARWTAGLPDGAPVQVLLVLAARFGRLQYKYTGMAYAAALKDVGVVYHALYLAATATGIGGCALGGGDALAFERASGLDRWDEGSVGEFLLTGAP